jgi:hypothetical protein
VSRLPVITLATAKPNWLTQFFSREVWVIFGCTNLACERAGRNPDRNGK